MKIVDVIESPPATTAMAGLEAMADRFWKRVDKNGPKQLHMKTRCWVWIGAPTKRVAHRQIASTYDVSPTTIRKVLNGVTWRHV